jgi:hypothetical protein
MEPVYGPDLPRVKSKTTVAVPRYLPRQGEFQHAPARVHDVEPAVSAREMPAHAPRRGFPQCGRALQGLILVAPFMLTRENDVR